VKLEADIVAILFIGTGVALYFLLMRTLGGMLVANGNETAGKTILNVFP